MSTMTAQFSADVQAVEPDLPVTFVFNGKAYTGQRNQTVDSLEMTDAGYIQKFDFELDVRTNAFAVDPPAENDNLKIDTTLYRVDQVTKSQDGVMLHLAMKAVD